MIRIGRFGDFLAFTITLAEYTINYLDTLLFLPNKMKRCSLRGNMLVALWVALDFPLRWIRHYVFLALSRNEAADFMWMAYEICKVSDVKYVIRVNRWDVLRRDRKPASLVSFVRF